MNQVMTATSVPGVLVSNNTEWRHDQAASTHLRAPDTATTPWPPTGGRTLGSASEPSQTMTREPEPLPQGTMLLPCFHNARIIPLPCYYHAARALSVLLPCPHHVLIMLVPCAYHATTMRRGLSPCSYPALTMLAPCSYHALTML